MVSEMIYYYLKTLSSSYKGPNLEKKKTSLLKGAIRVLTWRKKNILIEGFRYFPQFLEVNDGTGPQIGTRPLRSTFYLKMHYHSNFTFIWPCIVTNFFLIKPTDALISQIYFVKKLYMFRAVPLPITRSFPLSSTTIIFTADIPQQNSTTISTFADDTAVLSRNTNLDIATANLKLT